MRKIESIPPSHRLSSKLLPPSREASRIPPGMSSTLPTWHAHVSHDHTQPMVQSFQLDHFAQAKPVTARPFKIVLASSWWVSAWQIQIKCMDINLCKSNPERKMQKKDRITKYMYSRWNTQRMLCEPDICSDCKALFVTKKDKMVHVPQGQFEWSTIMFGQELPAIPTCSWYFQVTENSTKRHQLCKNLLGLQVLSASVPNPSKKKNCRPLHGVTGVA